MFAGASFSLLWQPTLMIISGGLQLLYLAVIGPLGRRFLSGWQAVPPGRALRFLAGLLVLYLAFGTPLDYLSDRYSFSAHMVQHLLEMLVMVPLLLSGTPDWLVAPLLRWRPSAIGLRVLTQPAIALAFFTAALAIFHLPGPYDETLANESFHFFEHSVFFLAALALWWPLLSPLPEELPPLKGGMRILYAIWAMNLGQPLNLLLVFSSTPWYPPYVAALRPFSLSPLADQQIGGAIMAASFFLVLAAVTAASMRRYDPSYWYA